MRAIYTSKGLIQYNTLKFGLNFRMNKSCFVCNEPAQRVCYHQNCDKNPFLCVGDCLNGQNQSFIAHTHDGKNKFLSYENVLTKVNNISNSVSLTSTVNKVAKRVEIIVGDLHRIMGRYQEQITKRELNLTKKVTSGIELFVSNQNNTKITGKNVNYLLTETNYYDRSNFQQKAIEIAQNQMNSILYKLQSLKLGQFLNLQKSKACVKEANNLANQQKFDQSVKQYQNALKINPFQQKYQKKIDQCRAWINSQQQYFESMFSSQHYNNAVLLHSTGRSNQAILEAQKAISLNKNNPYFHSYLALIYFTIKEYQKSIDAASEAIKLKKDASEFYYYRGDCYRAMHKYKEGIQDLTKSLELNKKESQAYNCRGICYFYEKQFQKAIDDYSKAMQLQRYEPVFYRNRANAYHQLHQYDKEFNDRSFVLKELQTKCQFSYYRRSELNYSYYKRLQEAFSDIQEAIKIDPKAEYLDLQSKILKDMGKTSSYQQPLSQSSPASNTHNNSRQQ